MAKRLRVTRRASPQSDAAAVSSERLQVIALPITRYYRSAYFKSPDLSLRFTNAGVGVRRDKGRPGFWETLAAVGRMPRGVAGLG